MQENTFTQGNIVRGMLRFSVPYLITCFLQTFYGMADLFIVGQFNGAASITAVSVGSQLMHMLTVVIAGFAMGSTVLIARSVGAGDRREIAGAVSSTFAVFGVLAVGLTVLLLACTLPVVHLLKVPAEAVPEAASYMRICFAGILFITAYNVVSAVFRGLGDTRRPMYYVAAAGIINIGLDWLLVGPLEMGAAGAAAATVASQGISVLLGLIALKKYHTDAFRRSVRPDSENAGRIIRIGLPIALQEGMIQVSFLVITMIANSRGGRRCRYCGKSHQLPLPCTECHALDSVRPFRPECRCGAARPKPPGAEGGLHDLHRIRGSHFYPVSAAGSPHRLALCEKGRQYRDGRALRRRVSADLFGGLHLRRDPLLLQRLFQCLWEIGILLPAQYHFHHNLPHPRCLGGSGLLPRHSLSHGTGGPDGVTSLRGHLPVSVPERDRVLGKRWKHGTGIPRLRKQYAPGSSLQRNNREPVSPG